MSYDTWKATNPADDDWLDWPPETCVCGHSGEEHEGPVCTIVGCSCTHFEPEEE